MSKHLTLTIRIAYDEATVTDVDGLASHLETIGYQLVDSGNLNPCGEVIDDTNVEVATGKK